MIRLIVKQQRIRNTIQMGLVDLEIILLLVIFQCLAFNGVPGRARDANWLQHGLLVQQCLILRLVAEAVTQGRKWRPLLSPQHGICMQAHSCSIRS